MVLYRVFPLHADRSRITAARIGHYNVETRLQLDLDVNAGGELQAHESLDRLVGRLQNVDQTLVRAGLELLTAVLVLVDSAQDRDDLLVGGQRDRAGNASASALSGLHDLLCRSIDQGCIVALQTDSDFSLTAIAFASYKILRLRRADKLHTFPGVQPFA